MSQKYSTNGLEHQCIHCKIHEVIHNHNWVGRVTHSIKNDIILNDLCNVIYNLNEKRLSKLRILFRIAVKFWYL